MSSLFRIDTEIENSQFTYKRDKEETNMSRKSDSSTNE